MSSATDHQLCSTTLDYCERPRSQYHLMCERRLRACCSTHSPTPQVKHVLDGGSLLHRLLWPRGPTFDSICTMYVDYVENFTTIMFDGYEIGPSTKNNTHLRRSGGVMSVNVNFDGIILAPPRKNTSWPMQTTSSSLWT